VGLFEATGIALNPVSRWSALKAWGTRLVKKIGGEKATVGGRRKLAVILHRMWRMPSRGLCCGPDSEDQNDCAPEIRRPPLPTP
jgi:hypothetical protein